jgi:plastocyanin
MKRAQAASQLSVRLRRPRMIAVALVAAALAAACGSSGDGSSTPTSAPAPVSSGSAAAGGGSTVEINNFAFTPKTLSVPAGTTVTWKFDDSTQHTVTADDNSFTSAAMGDGQTYTHTFDTAGTVKYHCSIHPFMTGAVVVK